MDNKIRIEKLTDALLDAHEKNGSGIMITVAKNPPKASVSSDLAENIFDTAGIIPNSLAIYTIGAAFKALSNGASGREFLKDSKKDPKFFFNLVEGIAEDI